MVYRTIRWIGTQAHDKQGIETHSLIIEMCIAHNLGTGVCVFHPQLVTCLYADSAGNAIVTNSMPAFPPGSNVDPNTPTPPSLLRSHLAHGYWERGTD